MIITKLQGGLGNQMFQAATAFALAKHYKTNFKLDLSFLQKNNISTDKFTAREYELAIFDYNFNVCDKKDLALFSQKKIFSFSKNIKISDNISPADILLLNIKNLYLDGYWQCQDFFIKYRNEILQIFRFNKIETEKIFDETVSIHIRRGDYVTNRLAKQTLGILSIDYYYKAIDYVIEHVKKPEFIVFSDDIEWAINHLKYKDIRFSFSNSSNSEDDLKAMSLCKHNIIANSSFSWWGAWLNQNSNKIVIAPKQWYADSERNKQKENIIPNNWIRI